MKIGELAKRSGLSAHTIRYYERIGLLPYAVRDQSRRRDYDTSILTWIEFLGRLKSTGMPIRDMLRYAELREKGGTEAQRRESSNATVTVSAPTWPSCRPVFSSSTPRSPAMPTSKRG